jgi:hypothetical protein
MKPKKYKLKITSDKFFKELLNDLFKYYVLLLSVFLSRERTVL